MRILTIPLLLTIALAGCEQAQRYPAVSPSSGAAAPKEKPPLPAHWSWMAPAEEPLRDAPIEFVPPSSPKWASLRSFWNPDPLPGAGAATIHLGLPPLQALIAFAMAEQMQVYRIRVPAGLPDPNPWIPTANPPSYAKWRLGRHLYFAPLLRSGQNTYACADCHKPDNGFSDDRTVSFRGEYNTPSLINAVYNRRQFWDGRASALEEVVVRSLDDERPAADDPARPSPEITHRWGGLVNELAGMPNYRATFAALFGIPVPTQDAIAKVMATYMRTLLSGDSLYDRAEALRLAAKAPSLTADHFLPLLDDAALKKLADGKRSKADAARQLARGYQLFHGKARCAVCHAGPLFTDNDFHNIGIDAAAKLPPFAPPSGRITTVPIGLKEERLVGAYKTPTLRALPRTAPYFHNGKQQGLRAVVTFYDHEIWPSRYLAAALRNGQREQKLDLTGADIDALVLFLESLDGAPLDPIVAAPTR